MPKWLLVLIIAVPAAGILGVVAWSQMRPEPETEVVDPNRKIAALEAEIGKIQKEFHAVSTLIRQEQEVEARARRKRLEERINRWLDEWEAILQPLRTADGDLPPDLQGYESVPAPVLRLRNDLLKISGFD